MLNIALDKNSCVPLYEQLIDYFKKEILSGHLTRHSRLPSVRQLRRELSLSNTTVNTVYDNLVADGYIISKPRVGYLVADYLPTPAKLPPELPPRAAANKPRYDFSNNYIDSQTFNVAAWMRQQNKVIKDPVTLSGYGDVQGERILREAIATYSYQARGIYALPEQIVIGAGTQSLLTILLGIWPSHGPKIVALEEPGFPQAEETFANHNWQVDYFDAENLPSHLPPLLLVSSSNPYKGRALTQAAKLSLVQQAQAQGSYILEDDYNGEFRYLSETLTSLQGLAEGKNVIYLGSFSRSLLPSLRISYMVLPSSLLECYLAKAKLYNQTSSTIEQLTLAHYILHGDLSRHVKKLRNLYNKKNKILQKALLQIFGSQVTILDYASGLHLRIALSYPYTAQEIAQRAAGVGVILRPLPDKKNKPAEILLSYAGIDSEDIPQALAKLKQALR